MFNLELIQGHFNKAVDYIDNCIRICGNDGQNRVEYIRNKVGALQQAYNKTADNTYRTRAIAVYESLVEDMPNNPNVLNNLAYMRAESNEKLELALKYAERVYELNPNHPGFLDTYAYVLYQNGRYEKAAEFLHSALQQYEQMRMGVPATVYKHLGMIKEKVGESRRSRLFTLIPLF